jgi:hypothetical protein
MRHLGVSLRDERRAVEVDFGVEVDDYATGPLAN